MTLDSTFNSSGPHILFVKMKINIILFQIGLSGFIHVKLLEQYSAPDKCLINSAFIIFFMKHHLRHIHILRKQLTIINTEKRNKIHISISSIFQAYYTYMRSNKPQKKEEKNKSVNVIWR